MRVERCELSNFGFNRVFAEVSSERERCEEAGGHLS